MPKSLTERESLDHRMRGGKFSAVPVLDDETDATAKAITELAKHNAEILNRLDEAQRMMADNQRVLSRLVAEHQVSVEKMLTSIIQHEKAWPARQRRIKFDVQRGVDGKIKTVVANITEE